MNSSNSNMQTFYGTLRVVFIQVSYNYVPQSKIWKSNYMCFEPTRTILKMSWDISIPSFIFWQHFYLVWLSVSFVYTNKLIWFRGLVGYGICLTRRTSPVRSWAKSFNFFCLFAAFSYNSEFQDYTFFYHCFNLVSHY